MNNILNLDSIIVNIERFNESIFYGILKVNDLIIYFEITFFLEGINFLLVEEGRIIYK